MNFITYAIDLGTTNSLIAKHENGVLQIFRNPSDNEELLPSVVAFKEGSVIVGNKAKGLREQGNLNVFSTFKRKIGTDYVFQLAESDRIITPSELSAYVLMELKKFVPNYNLDAAVITIPASFNTIQANATKLAAQQAGIKDVVLLQEPIAACLSIFNEDKGSQKKGKYLVFDLGGGTLDIALVNVLDDELKLIDHEGNNFLGGVDFDLALLEKLVLPQLSEKTNFAQTSYKLKTELYNGHYSKELNRLLSIAEKLKLMLTFDAHASISLYLTDDANTPEEVEFNVNLDDFNQVITPLIEHSIDLTKSVLHKNGLSNDAILGVVLVGGSTYLPLIKKKLEDTLSTKCFQPVDPSTAIVRGAAYYASNKAKSAGSETLFSPISVIYEKQTRDEQSLVIIRVNSTELLNKQLGIYNSQNTCIHQFLAKDQNQAFIPLVNNENNLFELRNLETNDVLAAFTIEQGKFVIEGQPLPHDICIEVDDTDSGKTKLDIVFEKNKVLPIKRVISKWVAKDLLQGGQDKLIINLLEGDGFSPPNTCEIIGSVEINPNTIQKNIPQDTEVKIELVVSENRDVSVQIIIPALNFEKSGLFTSTEKSISVSNLKENIRILAFEINEELNAWLDLEDYEKLAELQQMKNQIEDCAQSIAEAVNAQTDLVFSTFERYRKTAVQFDEIQRKNHLRTSIIALRHEANRLSDAILKTDFPSQLKFKFMQLKETENLLIQHGNVYQIKRLKEQYGAILWEYERESPEAMKRLYITYRNLPADAYTHQSKAAAIISSGDLLLDNAHTSASHYLEIIISLYGLLKEEWKYKQSKVDFEVAGTGLR